MYAGHMVAWALLLIGGLNWGLVGLFGFDLVDWLLGSWPIVARIVYVLVGLSAVLMLFKKKGKKGMGGDKKMEDKPADMPKPEAPPAGGQGGGMQG